MGLGGGGGSKPPEKSAAERELEQTQLSMLKEQRSIMSEQMRMQDLMAPMLYKGAGLTPIYSEGKIVGFDQAAPDELAGMRKDIESGFLKRTLAAQRGELSLDPALERGIGENQRSLEASLAQQLGPGYAASTPGIQAMAEASKGAEELRSSARRGELTLAEQLGVTREQANAQRQQQALANLGGVFDLPGNRSTGGTNYLNSLAQALQGYRSDRELALAGMPKKKNPLMNAMSMGVSGGTVGALAGGPYGAAIGGGAGFLSGLFM